MACYDITSPTIMNVRNQDRFFMFSYQEIPMSDSKRCLGCDESLPLDSFGDQRSKYTTKSGEIKVTVCKKSRCKPCTVRDLKGYRANQTEKARLTINKRQRDSRNFNRTFTYEYLLRHPCVRCGESDPVVLDFHHVDRENKKECVSRMYEYTLKTLYKEIQKCEVLCCHCHMEHHAKEFNYYKYRMREELKASEAEKTEGVK